MKVIILTTTLVVGNPEKAHKDTSAKRITDNVFFIGCKHTKSPGYKHLEPIVSITGLHDKNPKVEFTYANKKNRNTPHEISDFQVLDTDPLKITFRVFDGITTFDYLIIRDTEDDTWSGFISESGTPIYALCGEIREIGSK